MKRFLIYIARLLYGRRNSNSFPRILILLFDIFIVIFSYFLLMLLKDYDHLNTLALMNSLRELIPVLAVFIVIFLVTKSYQGMLRYSGFNDIVRLIYIAVLSFSVLSVSKFLLCHFSFGKHYFYRKSYQFHQLLLASILSRFL
jgi:FlaA1/EpsC-like NDP-sugar epimerase